jgi:uncharacterized RDD family membrane protein YckC
VPGQPPPPPLAPGGFQAPALPYEPGYGVSNRALLATPGRRIAARCIDWLIMIVVIVPVYVVVMLASAPSSTSTSSEFDTGDGVALGGFLLIMLLVTVGQVLYEVGFIAIKGATPGKMLMKVRVVHESNGQIPGWGTAFMRWLPTLVGIVPCVGSFLSLGLWIWALVNLFNNDKRQTPFDLAAKTVVIDASQS